MHHANIYLKTFQGILHLIEMLYSTFFTTESSLFKNLKVTEFLIHHIPVFFLCIQHHIQGDHNLNQYAAVCLPFLCYRW